MSMHVLCGGVYEVQVLLDFSGEGVRERPYDSLLALLVREFSVVGRK